MRENACGKVGDDGLEYGRIDSGRIDSAIGECEQRWGVFVCSDRITKLVA